MSNTISPLEEYLRVAQEELECLKKSLESEQVIFAKQQH